MQSFAVFALVASTATAHCQSTLPTRLTFHNCGKPPMLTTNPTDTLPSLNGAADWTVVRKANNWQDNGYVGDVTSDDIRCNQLNAGTDSISVAAGDTVTATFNNALYHPGPFRMFKPTSPPPIPNPH